MWVCKGCGLQGLDCMCVEEESLVEFIPPEGQPDA